MDHRILIVDDDPLIRRQLEDLYRERKYAVDTVGGGTVDDSSTEFGIDIGGGASFEVNEKSDIVAEGWYRIVSDLNQLFIGASWVYWLGE